MISGSEPDEKESTKTPSLLEKVVQKKVRLQRAVVRAAMEPAIDLMLTQGVSIRKKGTIRMLGSDLLDIEADLHIISLDRYLKIQNQSL